MRTHTFIALSALLLVDSGVGAQVLSPNLLYTTVQPCRLIDTRIAGGLLAAGSTRTFNVVGIGSPGSLSTQGGNPSGCPIPGFASSAAVVKAVALNFIAVSAAGPGDLRAWPSDQTMPTASIINYAAVSGLNIANGVMLPVRQDLQGGDITLKADVSGTQVVADVVGYFTKAQPQQYYLTTGSVSGNAALTACTTGYHMASLWEIHDTSNLQYNTNLGYTTPDSGQGPSFAGGWIRTGASSNTTATAGQGNCAAWSSNLNTDHGSVAVLSSTWADAAISISPWLAATAICDTPISVWCVENLP